MLSSRDLPNPEIEPASHALESDSLLLNHQGNQFMYDNTF